jgi:protease III
MLKKYIVYILALGALSGCTMNDKGASLALEKQIITSPNDNREYSAITLNNQLQLILVSDPSIEKSAAALSVGVGLLNDPMTHQGMAHYLEHMLFMGTNKYPDVSGYSEFMSNNGGRSNAYTWLDITNYMFEVNNDAFEAALDRFSDFFKSPKLYPEYTEKEKNAVNAEWSMRRELDFFGRFNLSRSMMGEHPANRFLIGNLESLSDKEEAKLHDTTVAFYNKYYSSNIMKASLISNLSIVEMEKLAEKYFSSIQNKEIDKPKVQTKLDFNAFNKQRIHYVPNEDVKQLILDFTINNNIESYLSKPNTFVSYILGSEMPGTPAFELKKLGLISSLNVSSNPSMYGNYGQLSIQLNLTDAGMKKRALITHVLMDFINEVRRNGVNKKYFSEIKNSLNNSFRFLEKGRAFNYASTIAAEQQSYSQRHAIAANYLYTKFDKSSIHNLLNQLRPERLRIWYISKEEPADHELKYYSGKYSIRPIDDREIAQWSKRSTVALTLPKVNNLLPERFELKTLNADQKKPKVVFNTNNIKVWHMPSENFKSQPKGTLEIYFNSDERNKDIKGQILYSLWLDLYKLKNSALLTEASIAGMYPSLKSSHGLILSISGFTDKQPLLLKSLIKKLNIHVSNEQFIQAVDRYIRNVKNSENAFPYNQLFSVFSKLTRSSGYSNNELVEAASRLTESDLKEFINLNLKNHNLRVFAYGNYDAKDLDNISTTLRSELTSNRSRVPYNKNKYILPIEGKTISYKKDIPVADVAVLDVFFHPISNLKQKAIGKILNSHIRAHAFDTLRTQEQLAYAVFAFTDDLDKYTGLFFGIQTPVNDVTKMQERFDLYRKEYKSVLDELPLDEFNSLKSSVLISLKEKPKNIVDEQRHFLADWYKENWEFNSKNELIAEIEAVTIEDLSSFYEKTVMTSNPARISIQLRGQKFIEKPFATFDNEIVIDDLHGFHLSAVYQQEEN